MRTFVGTVLPDVDETKTGRYKVNILALQPLMPSDIGIWVKNHIHDYRDTTSSSAGRYGQYFPLKPGTNVVVEFQGDDYNTGCITKILDDDIPNDDSTGTQYAPTVPDFAGKYRIPIPFNAQNDRDNFTQLLRTVKNSLLVVTDDTSGDGILPPNSIHLYHDNDKTRVIIDETGFHLTTKSNKTQNIAAEYLRDVLQRQYKYVKLDADSIVDKERRDYITNNFHILTGDSIYIEADKNAIHLLSPGRLGIINQVATKAISLSTTDKESFIVVVSRNKINISTANKGSDITISSKGSIEISAEDSISISASSIGISATGSVSISGQSVGIAATVTTIDSELVEMTGTLVVPTVLAGCVTGCDCDGSGCGDAPSPHFGSNPGPQCEDKDPVDFPKPINNDEDMSLSIVDDVNQTDKSCDSMPGAVKKLQTYMLKTTKRDDMTSLLEFRADKAIRNEPLDPEAIRFE